MTAPKGCRQDKRLRHGQRAPRIGQAEPEFVLVLEDRHQAVSAGARRRGLLYASSVDLLDEQAALMMTRAGADARFVAIERRLGSIEGRLGSVDGPMTRVEDSLAELSRQVHSLTRTLSILLGLNTLVLCVLTYVVAT